MSEAIHERPTSIHHPDGKARCSWPGTDPLYVAYHDTDWGVPEFDDRALFEKLMLDGFQAGLSLDHHPAQARQLPRGVRQFRAGDHGALRPEEARYPDGRRRHHPQPRQDRRHRCAARGPISTSWKKGSFSQFIWNAVDGRPVQNDAEDPRAYPGRDGRIAQAVQGAEAGGVQLRRPHHRLRLHAGGGHGQRSPCRLLPARGGEGAWRKAL